MSNIVSFNVGQNAFSVNLCDIKSIHKQTVKYLCCSALFKLEQTTYLKFMFETLAVSTKI